MSALATSRPTRRPELVIRPLGEGGRYVVKDPGSGEYFHIGSQEHFLLEQFDGRKDAETICQAFTQRFSQPLTQEELQEFVEMARGRRFLQSAECGAHRAERAEQGREVPPAAAPRSALDSPRPRQSILYWRKCLFDPDRFISWLEPKVRFFWTRAFFALSAGCILLAMALVWANGRELATYFPRVLRWETFALAWFTLLTVTMLHEFAHGLTCKHYGGEVHEIGFLLMFFLPCFYCNVSDAWLFKERSKRLWVTFAGGYFELFLWALAVFTWRLTVPGSLPNYIAWIVLMICGVQTLFNFNPLLKLDGYYLLSDWQEIPNLRQRAWQYVAGHIRWIMWGASRPERQPRGRFLLGFGLVSWLYSLVFLALMLWAFFHFLWSGWGWLGLGGIVLLGWASTRGLFQGFSAGEVRKMLLLRHKRTVVWLLLVGGAAAALYFIEIEDRSSGPFQVRAATRAELRAEVAGFLKEVYCDEGDRVLRGAVIGRLEIPELASRMAQKRAEVHEAKAKLRLLEVGSRPEEVAEQRQRVERAKKWRDLARKDLAQQQIVLTEDLQRLDQQIAACRAEMEALQEALERSRTLLARKATAPQETRDAERAHLVARAKLDQAQAEQRARRAKGTLEPEMELARREKELGDAQGMLGLLEAGSRPEDVDAARAHLAKLTEEVGYLEVVQNKLTVFSPIPGVITTARLKEKVGQYLREGELICLVEETGRLEIEVSLSEQDVERVKVGQEMALKVRALPFETWSVTVSRIAPAAAVGQVESTVTVYCQLTDSNLLLRPGMTGHARIYTGQRQLGAYLLDRVLRFVRTEFWW
ncbi:MAG: efflux RND transporter periplasmic adaptor subunit [Gemmataceae bacterium]|nr:efflux RND transporter periplasmic adaptor subunit [Gemmataceae bacterium]